MTVPLVMNNVSDVEIINSNGQIIFRTNNYRNNIPIGNVAVGLYFYRIKVRDKEGKLIYYRGKLLITE